jgi:flavin-binding protein dodecin
MSIVKVIELSSESPESWEDATRQAVERASRTIRNIRSVWVKEFEAVVDDNNVSQFRVNLKVSFLLDETQVMQSGENVGG